MHSSPGLVAILAYDGLCTFEFGIAVEIFGLARPEFDFPWYRQRIVGLESGPMRATGGIQVLADAGLELLPEARTIIIPGWRDRAETRGVEGGLAAVSVADRHADVVARHRVIAVRRIGCGLAG